MKFYVCILILLGATSSSLAQQSTLNTQFYKEKSSLFCPYISLMDTSKYTFIDSVFIIANDDPLYAGESDIGIIMPVSGNWKYILEECPPENHDVWIWWDDLDGNDRNLYTLLMIAVAAGYCCLLACCWFCGIGRRRDEEYEEEEIIKIEKSTKGGGGGNNNIEVNVDIEDIIKKCAAQAGTPHEPCTGYCGPIGSGNYVKM